MRRLRSLSLLSFSFVLLLTAVCSRAQTTGPGVNMISGAGWSNGDPFLQRQNEPSLAFSTRNTLHMFGSTPTRSSQLGTKLPQVAIGQGESI